MSFIKYCFIWLWFFFCISTYNISWKSICFLRRVNVYETLYMVCLCVQLDTFRNIKDPVSVTNPEEPSGRISSNGRNDWILFCFPLFGVYHRLHLKYRRSKRNLVSKHIFFFWKALFFLYCLHVRFWDSFYLLPYI